MYINDLEQIGNAHLTLFADDTTIACSNVDHVRLISDANEVLSSINEWTISNKLRLNVPKTAAIFITNRPVTLTDELSNLCICGMNVNVVDSFKFLGIQLDSKLNFRPHINYICSKLSKSAGMLYRASRFLPLSVMINLYYSFIYPYFLYGVLVWGNSSDIHLNPLVLLQKRIIRTVTSSSYLAHTEPLFRLTKILKVEDVFKLYLGIYMFKKKINNALVHPSHSYHTRHSSDVVPDYQRLTKCQSSLSYIGPIQWNSIPQNI